MPRIIDADTQQALTDLVRVNWGMGSQSITSVLLPGAEPDAIRRFNRSQRETTSSETAAALLGLTFDLDASEEHIEFPIISAVAREGRAMAGAGMPSDHDDLSALMDAIVETIPGPSGDPEKTTDPGVSWCRWR